MEPTDKTADAPKMSAEYFDAQEAGIVQTINEADRILNEQATRRAEAIGVLKFVRQQREQFFPKTKP